MTITVTVVTNPDESLYRQYQHIANALRRVAQDAAYAGIYDTTAEALKSKPITDIDNNLLATVSIQE